MSLVFSKSLIVKQALLTLVLAVVLSLISNAIQMYDGIKHQRKIIDQDFNELIAVVEQPLAAAVFRLDRAFAQQQINSLLLSPSIASVKVTDEIGHIFIEGKAEKRAFRSSVALADLMFSNLNTFQRSLTIEQPTFNAGILTVVPEKRYLMDRLLDTHIPLLVYNLLKDILLACLISLIFYYLVTYPLMRFTRSLTHIGQHQKQPLPDAFYQRHKSDELGHLHTTFTQLWTHLNSALSDLERSNSHTKAMIEHAADGILLLDVNQQIRMANSAAKTMLKLEQNDVTSVSLARFHDPLHWPEFVNLVDTLSLNSPQTVETLYQVQGRQFPVEIRLVKYDVQDQVETLMLIRNVSERKEAEAHIHHLAYYDPITDLPNRQYLTDRLTERLKLTAMQNSYSAVVFMDLDRFKVINDSLGHNVGDQLLRCVSKQLAGLVSSEVVFARMGGDEFAFLLEPLGDHLAEAEQRVLDLMNRITLACQQVKSAGHHEVHITASLGASVFQANDLCAEVILKQADTALYRAKESGRNTYAMYRPEMQAASDARLEMEKALHHATENKLFELYYQPQNNAEGELIGAEALLRWRDSNKGFISPAEFIPLAEEIGLIVEIGTWVLNEALSQVATWLEQGKWQSSWRMSINVSPIQFQQASFLPILKSQLEKHHVPASCVDLEITENTLLNDWETSLTKMQAIKELGVYLSIDDFGTGYSSLKYLKSLPIDRLKIDQSFVRDLLTDHSDEAIVHAVIAMAKALKINVLAEGVETLPHLDRLKEIHCFYYQGYYFGRPAPADQFIASFVHDSSDTAPSF
ncbi:putative bifunctional diguanylate cyclase/phosphodiesterase [Marinomonas posidonica]|uniref:Diguanylate cyclase/phosphodiesterase with PAS/PAC sensor(S) n=1 Tax=Marinomonas posidonica (strain CECT 7376 / NCIMB 14433 / IVIA-Po-181) TaxID=491952 RepID=F6CTD7_MARPP|nr:bifunctional diguanylate cyclase/phosphodiesterase [Marinomonas posidonica]AEF53986.1 diguanylate cyclase/phosphodiesterase with PAS/PAC sensor(s) [Marinomonas posidonica IVIA-Po-181]